VPRRYVIAAVVFAIAVLAFFISGGAYIVGCILFGGHDCS
jgi:hypothetical protein